MPCPRTRTHLRKNQLQTSIGQYSIKATYPIIVPCTFNTKSMGMSKGMKTEINGQYHFLHVPKHTILYLSKSRELAEDGINLAQNLKTNYRWLENTVGK